MPVFILILMALLLLVLVMIWTHFLRKKLQTTKNSQTAVTPQSSSKARDETNITLYHEHKSEIEDDYKQGHIDEESYQYLINELDKSLLQDIAAPEETMITSPRFSILWPIVLSVAILAISFSFYSKIGAYETLTQTQPQSNMPSHDEAQVSQARVDAMQSLKDLIEKEPQNSNAWYSLGQAFVGIGEYEKAMEAFDQVLAIEGEKADVLGAQAQALYYKSNQKITPQVQVLIDRALALDANDASTNILLGMNNFIAQEYTQAIHYWQVVINANKENVNVEAIQQAINEAQNRLALSGSPQEQAFNGNKSKDVEANEAISDDSSSPQLQLNITLSEDILAKVSQGEDKTVFVYAVPNDGRRMPVAALKIRASDLPANVVLNNSRAMSPQANLSSVDAVHLYAVISNSGSVGIKAGDFIAEKKDVSVTTQTSIALEINTVAP